MECPHIHSNVCLTVDPSRFPNGIPSSWCCNVCRSNKSPWVCLTCLLVHCGRYVSGHAKKHFEENQVPCNSQRTCEKQEKVHHSVCMDCSNYSLYCYRCDDFVVNDTKLGQVQKVREHLQSLEKSSLMGDRQRKRKNLENLAFPSKGLSLALCATGLRNLGNTCFMNAILQSLSNIQQFSRYFKELPAVALRSGKTAGRRMYHTRSQGDTSVSLVEELRKTLCSLWQGNQTAFSPDSLFYAIWKIMPSFRGYQQQDAHEFMRYLLDHLHRELQGNHNGVPSSASSPDHVRLPPTAGKCCINGITTVVTSIFGGILQNEVNCLICGTESRKFDPFLDLSLDIPSQFRQKKSKDQEPGPTCTLSDCLRSFTDLEELDDAELYMCHKCIKRQKSTKKFWIQKLPKVLCLHLKRFHWTAFLRNKVDTYVEFPLHSLDMRAFLLEPEKSLPGSCLYDLVAVVVHHGSGVGSGHYTAYGCHEGRWYHFNDSTVTVSSEDTVRKAKAYILFYVERPAKAGAADAGAAAQTVAVDTASASADEMVSVRDELKEEDVAGSAVTPGAGSDPVPSPQGVTAGAGSDPDTTGAAERDRAALGDAAGGQLASAGWEEEALDGDQSCEATSDTVTADSDSLTLASAAAQ
ncbi:ubiquitin carboxyl-terminal hydrolase 3 isoform X2 [Gadus morhua]|uniref:ubiquitin carboxyl-terminal hydrolase 3 isoform X2 n=1 Tax=Gadus morhua TaxID=8049 RepID=UPI0011B3CD79|nr:ubiquitin carboxyl-terminal hydrolase 3 isoform X2 [Gadus morhua]